MRPRFLSQKIEQKEPEKKIPSIAAKAIRRSAKQSEDSIHLKAQLAFYLTLSMLSTASNRNYFSTASSMYVSIRMEYVSEWMFSIIIWKP